MLFSAHYMSSSRARFFVAARAGPAHAASGGGDTHLFDTGAPCGNAHADPRGKKYISMDNWTSFMGSSYITAARKRTADFLMARMEAIQATTETDDDYGKLASLLCRAGFENKHTRA